MEGTIFDIKECSIHDGPGIRVTVFLKGCPLRCLWCHNPEGLTVKPQLIYKKNMCTQCGNCKEPCNHPECKPWGRCIHACPQGALDSSGENINDEKLARKLVRYKDFFEAAGGGVTISGGEPMMQPDFVCAVLDRLGGIHKAIQTSGYTDEETYKRVINKVDYVMQDIKLADTELHKKYTGVSNEKILKNIEWLKLSGKEFVFRVPLIPEITDTEENLMQISKLVGDCPVELLSYNKLAGAKYDMLGIEYPMGDVENRKEDFGKYFSNAVLRM